MNRHVTVVVVSLFAAAAWAAPSDPKPTPTPDRAVYQPRYRDPVLKEIKDRADAAEDSAKTETKRIRDTQDANKEAEKKDEKVLRFDMSKISKPAGPAVFAQAWHFPPVAQFATNTCWSFSTTSYFESEVFRLTGQKVKLSELWTVYWEYVEKVRRFVRERGDSYVAEGSEANAVTRIWKQYGVVPEEIFPGVRDNARRLDHTRLIERITKLLGWLKENDLWDEGLVLAMTRAILDREIGVPSEHFSWHGETYTPQEFLSKVLRLNIDDYVVMMSTLSLPFYTKGEYKVPDNWWHDAGYYNVPLDDWYTGIKKAVAVGQTVAIGGDVSEPGLNGFEDAAIIPSFDIPAESINQDSRELRFDNKSSQDDHGIHLVGMTTTPDGHEWFLIKDSNRSSRWGRFEGYYFYRDDYVRLKMLTYLVHKEAVKDSLARFR